MENTCIVLRKLLSALQLSTMKCLDCTEEWEASGAKGERQFLRHWLSPYTTKPKCGKQESQGMPSNR